MPGFQSSHLLDIGFDHSKVSDMTFALIDSILSNDPRTILPLHLNFVDDQVNHMSLLAIQLIKSLAIVLIELFKVER